MVGRARGADGHTCHLAPQQLPRTPMGRIADGTIRLRRKGLVLPTGATTVAAAAEMRGLNLGSKTLLPFGAWSGQWSRQFNVEHAADG